MSGSDYETIDASLSALGVDVGAAEAHGCLCGILCMQREGSYESWLGDLLPEEQQASSVPPALRSLHAEAGAAIDSAELDFMPLLPDDERPLDERAQALGAWCAGFLRGLARGGLPEQSVLVDKLGAHDVVEVLGDFAEIARAAHVGEESTEAAENAYAELVEYVRVGAMTVNEEFVGLRGGGPDRALH